MSFFWKHSKHPQLETIQNERLLISVTSVFSVANKYMIEKDFYIGYLKKMPKSLARFVKPLAALFLAVGVGLVFVFWLGQKPFAKSYFEFGQEKAFEGTIQAQPIPFLLVEKAEKFNGLPSFQRIPLVAVGKHGVDEKVTKLNGQRVKLKGTLIYRDGLQMIEVVDGSAEVLSAGAAQMEERTESLGTQTLRGEIVDSKCYLGVMNPGQSKPHRECAVRCISGGIPPLFVVKDTKGNTSELWLLSEKGETVNRDVLDFVAEPLEITGEVKRLGDQLFFYTNVKNLHHFSVSK